MPWVQHGKSGWLVGKGRSKTPIQVSRILLALADSQMGFSRIATGQAPLHLMNPAASGDWPAKPQEKRPDGRDAWGYAAQLLITVDGNEFLVWTATDAGSRHALSEIGSRVQADPAMSAAMDSGKLVSVAYGGVEQKALNGANALSSIPLLTLEGVVDAPAPFAAAKQQFDQYVATNRTKAEAHIAAVGAGAGGAQMQAGLPQMPQMQPQMPQAPAPAAPAAPAAQAMPQAPAPQPAAPAAPAAPAPGQLSNPFNT